MEEEIGVAGQAARAALYRDAAVFARLALAELRKVIEIDLHVAADEQIEMAIAIVVREPAPGRPAGCRHAGLFGDIRERPVAVVVVQAISADRRHVEIFPAVAVDIRRADAHAPAWMPDARLVGDILELSVSQIPVERASSGVRVFGGVDSQ